MKRLLLLSSLILLVHSSPADELRIHLGYTEKPPQNISSDTAGQWNLIRTWGPTSHSALLTTEGASSQITWETMERFSFHFDTGPETSELGYPPTVSHHGFYLARKEKVGNQGPFSKAVGIIRGLEPQKLYSLTFYGTRMANHVGDISLHITAAGQVEEQASLHLAENGPLETEETLSNLRPNEDGAITLTFQILDGYNRGTINNIIIREKETR